MWQVFFLTVPGVVIGLAIIGVASIYRHLRWRRYRP